MKSKFAFIVLAVIVGIVIGIGAGIIIGAKYAETSLVQSIKNIVITETAYIDKTGFVSAKIDITGNTVSLSNSCYEISFDVTDDQAFSIHRGISKEIGARPLTHDIFSDVLKEFNITLVQIRIERFGDDIYYARAFAQQWGKVLDLDLRPSDAIALSLRTGDTLYINQSMLQEKGRYIC